jgi:predicted glycoside hydrolase/deacetylase ChbG (UPF0249 family)
MLELRAIRRNLPNPHVPDTIPSMSIRLALAALAAVAITAEPVLTTIQPTAAAGAVRLIVQGDDMAAGHGINVATIEAYKKGILRSANVIIPAPWLPEAARLLRENPEIDAGIHLALTSEWEAIKWRPLTTAPSLVDEYGFFFPMVTPRKGFPDRTSLSESKIDLGEVERELRAQIELAKKLIPHVTYTWEHMLFGMVSPDVRAIVTRLTNEYGLIAPGPELGIRFLGRVWDQADNGTVRAEKLAAKLQGLAPGTWLMVDHAATDSPEIRAFGHLGYEAVAADRTAVVEAWTSPQVLAAVKARGIELTTYRALLKAR